MAIFQYLADLMNSKSATPGEECLTISVSRKQVAKCFFKVRKGKEPSKEAATNRQ